MVDRDEYISQLKERISTLERMYESRGEFVNAMYEIANIIGLPYGCLILNEVPSAVQDLVDKNNSIYSNSAFCFAIKWAYVKGWKLPSTDSFSNKSWIDYWVQCQMYEDNPSIG